MTAPTNLEQLYLELINEARLNPQQNLARFISSYSPLASSNTDVQSALTFFGVDGVALQNALAALQPVQPLAWNDALNAAARTHNEAMIANDQQGHQLPGEAALSARIEAAGYSNWSAVAENVFAFARSAIHGHAGFMVDWGSGPGGMQSPPGHRLNIMSANYREVGISVIEEANPQTSVGPLLVTQNFAARFGGPQVFVVGVGFNDADRNNFYSLGEGLPGMTVSAGASSSVSTSSGGYNLGLDAGTHELHFSGGPLSSPVTFTTTLTAGTSAKIDIVGASTLKTSVAGTIGGAITAVEVLGINGLALTGNDVSQSMAGGIGHDQLSGSGGNDTLDGGAGNDTLYAGAGSDTVSGADGNDILVGHEDVFDTVVDTLNGGAGDDTLYAEASDSLQGGAGRDLLYIVNSNPINTDLGAAGIEWVQSDFGNDVIDGASQTVGIEVYSDGGNDTITGSGLNDIIWSGSGNDAVSGGAGNDVIVADIGVDTLSGGAGNDSLYLDAGDSVDGGAGFDAAYITGGAGMTIDMAAANLEWAADFAGGNDSLDGAASGSALEVYAAGGTDTVTGGTGADFLWGGAGNDTVSGNAGNDTLVGESGADTLLGGAGIDNLYGNSGNGGDGAQDTFVFTDGWGTDFVFDFDDGVDRLDVSAVSGLNSITDVTVTNTPDGHAYVHFGVHLIAVANSAGLIGTADFVF